MLGVQLHWFDRVHPPVERSIVQVISANGVEGHVIWGMPTEENKGSMQWATTSHRTFGFEPFAFIHIIQCYTQDPACKS